MDAVAISLFPYKQSASSIFQCVVVQCGNESLLRIEQVMFEPARFADKAHIRTVIEAFHDIHVRLQRAHDVSESVFLRAFREANAAALAFDTFHISKLRQLVHDLDHMVIGNFVMIGHLTHAAKALGMPFEKHQRAKPVIGENRQLHSVGISTQNPLAVIGGL